MIKTRIVTLIIALVILMMPTTAVYAQDGTTLDSNDINDFFDKLASPPKTALTSALLVVGGVILLLMGWRIYEYIIIIAGALIGAMTLLTLAEEANALVEIGAFLVGGLVGAVLAIFVYYIAVFLIGLYTGIAVTHALAVGLSLTPVSSVALLVGGIIGGLVLLALSFELLIILSSLVGAQMLALGLDVGPGWALLFALMGILLQLAATRYTNYEVRRRPSYWRHSRA